MSVTGAVINAILLAITDFMSIRVSMGVDTGSIARNSGGGRNQPKFHRRDNGNERKELLEEFFIMKRENPSGFRISSNFFCDTRMSVRQFFSFTWLRRRFFILVFREQILASRLLGRRILKPKPIDKIKIGAKRWKGVRSTADEDSKKVIRSKFSYPVGKSGKTSVEHDDKRTQDLRLVYGRPSGIRVIGGKELPDRVKIHRSKFIQ